METSTRARLLRLGALGMLLAGLLVAAEVTGLRNELSIAHLREVSRDAGPVAILAFTAAFSAGMLIHVPGMIFVATAITIWGHLWGGLIAWGSSLVAISVSFLVARTIGGEALDLVSHQWMVAILARLHRQPIRTVALIRLLSVSSAAATLALALSRVRYRTMILGSAIGLAPPILITALFLERVLGWLGY